jgi:hypothetical protein
MLLLLALLLWWPLSSCFRLRVQQHVVALLPLLIWLWLWVLSSCFWLWVQQHSTTFLPTGLLPLLLPCGWGWRLWVPLWLTMRLLRHAIPPYPALLLPLPLLAWSLLSLLQPWAMRCCAQYGCNALQCSSPSAQQLLGNSRP